MNKIRNYLNKFEIFAHETKRNVFLRFLLVLLVIIGYFLFVSFEYGIENGFLITLITWSFFVFCTPIADAGFVIDFPIRLITKIRMFYSEIAVWVFAALINLFAILFYPEVYSLTTITSIFYHIIFNPIPYWLIIILSLLGTFLSVYFGDELIDVIKHKERLKFLKHKDKHRLIFGFFALILVFLIYFWFITSIGF